MTIYHIWCNIRDSSKDLEFVEAVKAYLGYLKEQGYLHSFRIMRRKFGFSPPALADFHVMIECEDLGKLDDAFALAATRSDKVEALHRPVFSAATDVSTALYRDFPDAGRKPRKEK